MHCYFNYFSRSFTTTLSIKKPIKESQNQDLVNQKISPTKSGGGKIEHASEINKF